ncbi:MULTISPECIES: cbb3-type cytochrome oxidase subunit 3 [Leeia]|uniref:Cbb3-type cytochrome c oxidase subunit 3 n=1 Tax=Leeia aquatica TaxID=2725557 RepID=A0A847RSD5_9NEIS|nr:cbb3-type cytochrome c oxidase subunit 3 [Leeia aquatica]NLR74120.1 cbb3-type cytochrome c oxidase subunit 3 [Leeia aquatica]
MDINILRGVMTAATFLVFLGVIWWAILPKNRSRFEQAAHLPFADDDKPAQPSSGDQK